MDSSVLVRTGQGCSPPRWERSSFTFGLSGDRQVFEGWGLFLGNVTTGGPVVKPRTINNSVNPSVRSTGGPYLRRQTSSRRWTPVGPDTGVRSRKDCKHPLTNPTKTTILSSDDLSTGPILPKGTIHYAWKSYTLKDWFQHRQDQISAPKRRKQKGIRLHGRWTRSP